MAAGAPEQETPAGCGSPSEGTVRGPAAPSGHTVGRRPLAARAAAFKCQARKWVACGLGLAGPDDGQKARRCAGCRMKDTSANPLGAHLELDGLVGARLLNKHVTNQRMQGHEVCS